MMLLARYLGNASNARIEWVGKRLVQTWWEVVITESGEKRLQIPSEAQR